MIEVNLRIYFFENYDKLKSLEIQSKSIQTSKIDCYKFNLYRNKNGFIATININKDKLNIIDDLYTKREIYHVYNVDDDLFKNNIKSICIELFQNKNSLNYILNDLEVIKND
jgi:hypothetical protein